MAKKALVNKAAGKPRFAVRAYTRCSSAAARVRSTASSGCAGFACARWRTRVSCPACRRAAGNGTRGLEHMTALTTMQWGTPDAQRRGAASDEEE